MFPLMTNNYQNKSVVVLKMLIPNLPLIGTLAKQGLKRNYPQANLKQKMLKTITTPGFKHFFTNQKSFMTIKRYDYRYNHLNHNCKSCPWFKIAIIYLYVDFHLATLCCSTCWFRRIGRTRGKRNLKVLKSISNNRPYMTVMSKIN